HPESAAAQNRQPHVRTHLPSPRRRRSRRSPRAQAPRPDLILLDLNLPKYDGRQVLEKIKSDQDLSDIPVVVLTTSSAEEDILRSYKLHANAYVTKPVDLDQFIAAVRQIDDFFVQVVRLPRHRI
ncbi:response regulator, partial [Streptomyces olivaceus]